ncbi:hypothetical protein F2Q69_00023645 [Brassica cretica]|uniref:Uncharacterized protein n=1 Tax=Brassica cretica TaxID=69181 RepID=A0A8S9QH65_BRACR|nr:hypothetical protein F2Q69_00023645 [Brassica cretica]
MKLVTLIAEERGRSQKPAYDSTDEATSTYPDAKSSDSSGVSDSEQRPTALSEKRDGDNHD